MVNPLPPVKAVLFDAYGTLLDVHSVAQRAEQLFPGQGESLSRLWRDKQIDVTRLLTMGNRYQPFRDVTRAGLRFAARALRLSWSSEAEECLMQQYGQLSAFAENRGVLLALRERGIRAGTLSNGDPDMLEAAKPHLGLEFDQVISVEAAGSFKPHVATYRTAAELLGAPPDAILFVANHAFDCVGAKAYGMRTCFVDRRKRPFGEWPYQPDLVVSDFSELAAVLT